jgi:hypothetical protein
VFPVYGIRLTVFRPVGEHLSQRGVVDNFKITSYNVASRIIFYHKSVKSKIPPYFKDQSVPLISYVYIRPIASKMFNYKHMLRHHNIDEFNYKPPDCTCASSSFIYSHSSPIRKEYLSPPFKFYPLSGIILDRIHKYFKVVFPVYGIRLTVFRPVGEHLSHRGVVDNFKITSYNGT